MRGGHNKKNYSVTQFKRIDSFELMKYSVENTVPLYINGAKHEIALSHVINGFGGRSRIYFLCPRCQSRVRYLQAVESGFFCRHCIGLSYPVQRTGRDQIIYYQLLPLFRKLKTDMSYQDVMTKVPPKPPRMRWKTYFPLAFRIQALQEQHWNYHTAKVQNLFNSFTKM